MHPIQSASQNSLPNGTSAAANKHHQIVIVGGGAAGITVAAQLLKQNPSLDVAIIEPSEKHYYQPGWTLVGGGVAPMSAYTREEQSVLPEGATWIQARVAQLDPDRNRVITEAGRAIAYN